MNTTNAAARYSVMVSKSVKSAIAWGGMGMRLTMASRVEGLTAGQRTKLLDRAEDCYARATRCRLAK